LPGNVELGNGHRYINTGSWTFNSSQYALWDGQDFQVRDWMTGHTYQDEAYHRLMTHDLSHISAAEWWRINDMGWLRYRVGEEARLDAANSGPSVVVKSSRNE
jgi:hypothetical protein